MEITGIIKVINDTVQVSDKFAKREFVVVTFEPYPQEIIMQATQDKCSMLDSYKVGDNVKCNCNLRGRMWTSPQGDDKYFLSLECWKIEKGEGEQPTSDDDDLPDFLKE